MLLWMMLRAGLQPLLSQQALAGARASTRPWPLQQSRACTGWPAVDPGHVIGYFVPTALTIANPIILLQEVAQNGQWELPRTARSGNRISNLASVFSR